MRVSYHRGGGGRSGVASSEWLSIDGDTFEAWRTVGASAAGRFAGTLTPHETARLTHAVAACETAEPAHPPVRRPGATSVQVDIGSTSVTYGRGSPPPGPWTELDNVLQELCDAVVDRPTGAIGIEAAGVATQLVHRGHDPIAVDLSGGTFVAIAYTGWYHEEARSEGALDGGRVTAAPGWSVPIPVGELPDSETVSDKVTVHVTARFTIGEGRDAKQVEITHAPELERPD